MPKPHPEKKETPSADDAEETGCPDADEYLSPSTKSNFKWIKHLNVKPESTITKERHCLTQYRCGKELSY